MHQAFRPIAVMLGIVLVISAPAQAGPIRLLDVVQTITNNESARQNAQLQLRAVSQQTNGVAAPGTKNSSQTSSTSGTTPQGGSNQNVETIELGDVTGTICDCGEIALPGGGFGFSVWPLLGLAAVPLAFLDFGEGGGSNPPFELAPSPTPLTPTPTPPTPPTPPTTPIPEPATLLLFGSSLLALGAGARRRRAYPLAEAERDEIKEGQE